MRSRQSDSAYGGGRSERRRARAGGPARGAAGLALLAAVLVAAPARAEDWPTARGNPARTGCLDDRAGPASPEVLWVYQPKEHFAASPALTGRGILVAGIGAFYLPTLHHLSLEDRPAKRVLWSRYMPPLQQPIFGGPAVSGGLAVFGDGQHSSPGSTLYCFEVESGRLVWQLPKTGKFIHMEGTPTLAEGLAVLGAGNDGVLCVRLRRVVLDGNELDASAALEAIDARRRELQAAYERDKAKDPTFAIPPSEASLPKAAPAALWQKGAGEWHVDAPVAVAGGRVLAASAYVDRDRIGWRGLLCLGASDGNLLWRTPLPINPWGGPTLAGDRAIVGCSSIAADPELIPSARGCVSAIALEDGRELWRRDVGGGVLSPVAAGQGLAVCTATDGKVYALDPASGEVRWTYDGGSPFFAAPALAGGVVYAADLKGVLHAIALADGKKQWTLDTATHPAVKRPGMVYGSPVVQGGRVYVVTCNFADMSSFPCSVICVGEGGSASTSPASARAPAGRAPPAAATAPARTSAPAAMPTSAPAASSAPASAPAPRRSAPTRTVTGEVKEVTDEYVLLQEAGDVPRRYWLAASGKTNNAGVQSAVSSLHVGDTVEIRWSGDGRRRLESVRPVAAAPQALAARALAAAPSASAGPALAATSAASAPASVPAPPSAPGVAVAAGDTLAERVNGWIDNLLAVASRLVDLPLSFLLAGLAVAAGLAALLIRRLSRKPARARAGRALSVSLGVLLVLAVALVLDRKIAHLQEEVRLVRAQNAAQAGAILEAGTRRPSARLSLLFDPSAVGNALAAQFGEANLRPAVLDEATDYVSIGLPRLPVRAHLAIVDLTCPLLEIKLGVGLDRKTYTSDFAREAGCSVAINGEAGQSPAMNSGLGTWRGNLVSQGKVLLREEAAVPRPFLSFTKTGRATFTSADAPARQPAEGAYNVIWGRWDVLVAGQVRTADVRVGRPGPLDSARQPRTAMAISAQGDRLYLLVADGRQAGASVGLTRAEVGRLLQAFGAHDGMLCDEGGSSCMYVRRLGGLVNVPSDNQGRERPTYTHFGIALRGST